MIPNKHKIKKNKIKKKLGKDNYKIFILKYKIL